MSRSMVIGLLDAIGLDCGSLDPDWEAVMYVVIALCNGNVPNSDPMLMRGVACELANAAKLALVASTDWPALPVRLAAGIHLVKELGCPLAIPGPNTVGLVVNGVGWPLAIPCPNTLVSDSWMTWSVAIAPEIGPGYVFKAE